MKSQAITLEQIKEKAIPVLKQAGVLRSSIFGSAARGEATADSDIDLLVELPKGKSLFDLAELQMDLEKILGKKVDVGTFRSIKPRIKEKVLSEQVEIYAG